MAKLIVFEGLDGAGTTTQSKLLAEKAGKAGRVFWDKEPTDGDIGKMIRGILKDKQQINPITLLQLFLADRTEHQRVIKQKFEEKTDVILDRYLMSTMAYQGLYFDLSDMYMLNQNFMKPDLTFYVDIDPETALKRKKADGPLEMFEELHIQQRVRANYFHSAAILMSKGWNIVYLNGAEPIADLEAKIAKALKTLK